MVPALLESGRVDEAEAAIRAGRTLLLRGLGTAFVLLMSLAPLAQRRDKSELAARLVGCADHHYSSGGHHLHPPEQRMRESVLSALRAHHAPAQIEAWLADGACWSEDEAFAQAGIA
jgi:hypothetical protein